MLELGCIFIVYEIQLSLCELYRFTKILTIIHASLIISFLLFQGKWSSGDGQCSVYGQRRACIRCAATSQEWQKCKDSKFNSNDIGAWPILDCSDECRIFKCSDISLLADIILKTFLYSKTIRRKRKVQIPVSRPGDRETMSEHEEEDSDEDDGYDHHSGRAGQSAYGGASGGTGTGRRQDRERSSSSRRDHSASRERSISPRSDRRSQASSAPTRPAKVTLVKSRKNEGWQHNVQSPHNTIASYGDT